MELVVIFEGVLVGVFGLRFYRLFELVERMRLLLDGPILPVLFLKIHLIQFAQFAIVEIDQIQIHIQRSDFILRLHE